MKKTLPTGRDNPKLGNGFSLIELLVALAITSILISAISYVVFDREQSLKAISTAIVQNIRLVQQRAIREDRTYKIELNLAENAIYFIDDVVELSNDVSLTVRTAENQIIDRETVGITFFPDFSSSGGLITLESKEEIFQIAVNWISGKISIHQDFKNA